MAAGERISGLVGQFEETYCAHLWGHDFILGYK